MTTAAKIRRMLSEQTGQAQQVFASVPVEDHWTSHQVMAECQRKGIQIPLRRIEGCLHSLFEAGLVIKTENRGKARWNTRYRPTDYAPERQKTLSIRTPTMSSKQPETLSDEIDKLSEELLAIAERLSAMKSRIDAEASRKAKRALAKMIDGMMEDD